MNISPVSFSGVTSTQNFEELLKKPQVYRQETPAASSGISKPDEHKKSPLKKIAAGVIVAAAAATGLGYAAKTGKLQQLKYGNKNKILNKIKKPLNKAGTWIYEKADVVKNMITTKLAKNPSSVQNPPAI